MSTEDKTNCNEPVLEEGVGEWEGSLNSERNWGEEDWQEEQQERQKEKQEEEETGPHPFFAGLIMHRESESNKSLIREGSQKYLDNIVGVGGCVVSNI